MDIDIQKQPTNHIKDRILRFKPVAFVKRNYLVFLVLTLFLLSILFGIWNVKSYTLTDEDGSIIPNNVEKQIEEYLKDKLIGKNYFTFSTTPYEEDMVKNIPYLKDIKIEKVAPNKLEMFAEVYKASNTAYLREKDCYLTTHDGYILEHICQEDTANCCKTTALNNEVYMFSSSETDITNSTDGKQELMIMEEINKVADVIKTYQYTINNITLENSIIEVTLDNSSIFRFTTADDIDTQLERFIVVANTVKSDNLNFKSIDFRFEKPVLKK